MPDYSSCGLRFQPVNVIHISPNHDRSIWLNQVYCIRLNVNIPSWLSAFDFIDVRDRGNIRALRAIPAGPAALSANFYTENSVLPRTRTKFGERGFFYSGPAAWNTLPSDLHDIDTSTFRKRLKNILFDRAYNWLLLALLDESYSGTLQISRWLIDWLIDPPRSGHFSH